MTTVPPPAVDLDVEFVRSLAVTSEFYATNPRVEAGPEQSDLEHPDRSPLCNGRSIPEHGFCGGEYATQTGDTDCQCPCHHHEPTC